MKSVSPQMLALLKTGQFYSINLYTVELSRGAGTLRYCAGSQDIIANGIRYPATGVFGSGSVGGPYFDTENNKFKMHQKIGLSVDQLTFDVLPGHATINGIAFVTACRQGVLDGGIITVERAIMPTYGDTTAGTIIIFKGIVGTISVGKTVCTFNVNSYLDLLSIDVPLNIFQAACTNTLGDSSCLVNVANYATPLTVAANTTNAIIFTDVSGVSAGYYDLGRVTFTSGTLKFQSRTVRTCTFGTPGQIAIVGVWPTVPQVGDAFTLTPGCDKSIGANGCLKFQNLSHFRGFRSIPAPATAF